MWLFFFSSWLSLFRICKFYLYFSFRPKSEKIFLLLPYFSRQFNQQADQLLIPPNISPFSLLPSSRPQFFPGTFKVHSDIDPIPYKNISFSNYLSAAIKS